MGREIVVVVGRSGSGKTALLSKVFAPRHPRRITFDLTGECRALYPAAMHVHGAARCGAVLREWWKVRLHSWHLVVGCSREDAALIISTLCPVFDGKSVSLSELWGGIAVECFELDVFLPVSADRGAAAWRTAFLRGRHVGLSLLCATQYPSLVDRVATSQATCVATFGMHEPTQLDYMRRLVSPRFEAMVRELRQFESLWVHQSPVFRVEHRNPRYGVIRAWSSVAELS